MFRMILWPAQPGGRRGTTPRPLLVGSLAFSLVACGGGGPPQVEESPSPAPSTPAPTPTSTPGPPPTAMPTEWVERASATMEFWRNSNVDSIHGGYYTNVDRVGEVGSDTSKWTRAVSREVYGFTRAFQLTGDLAYLDSARLGVDWLLEHAADTEHGGFYTRLSESGQVLDNSRSLFDQVYALTGLTAWLEVTADPDVKELLTRTVTILQTVAWDSNSGGYYNALTGDMKGVADARKGFNAQVDTATAYLLNLLAATNDAGYHERLESLGLVVVDHLIDPDGTGWIGELFDQDWNYLPEEVPYGADRTICGHNLKLVWTLARLHLVTASSLFLNQAEDLMAVALGPCRDRDLGGIYDQVDRASSTIVSYDSNPENASQKPWWQQEQGMLSAQLLYAILGKSYYEKIWLETRDFYLRYHQDTRYGEVFPNVYGDGSPKDTYKGSPDKSAYHSMETAYVSYLYDSFFFQKTPVTLYYHFEPAEVARTVRLVPIETPYGTYTIDDPTMLEASPLALDTPSQVIISAGESGTLAVTYRPGP